VWIAPFEAWSHAITSSKFAAESLVRAYLYGRTLPEIQRSADVWVAEKRLIDGKMPVLDQTLRSDLDNQAVAPQKCIDANQPI
jgi:hypothetical protein